MRSWQKINGVIEKVVTDRQATGRPNDLLTGRKKKSIFNPSSGSYWSLSIQIHHHHWGALTLHRTLHTVTFKPFQTLHVWSLMSDAWCLRLDVWGLMSEAWCLRLDVWELMSEAWCLRLDVWELMSKAWCLRLDLEVWNKILAHYYYYSLFVASKCQSFMAIPVQSGAHSRCHIHTFIVRCSLPVFFTRWQKMVWAQIPSLYY